MVSAGHVVMTELEIAARCRLLNIARPVTLPNAATDDADGLGNIPDSQSSGAQWVTDLLSTLAAPLVVVFGHRQETGSVAEMVTLAASSSWVAEQIAQPGSAYSLSLFPVTALLDRVSAFCRLSDRSASGVGVCELSGRGFLKAAEQAGADPEGARRTLRAEGLGSQAALALAGALTACERRVQVTVVERLEGGRLEGSTVAWLDGGITGLWRVSAPMLASSGDYGDYGDALLDRTIITISPASRTNLVAEIIEGFPDGVFDDLRPTQ